MDLNRYKKEIGFGLVVIAVVCLLAVIIFKEDKENSEDDVPQKSVTIDIPEGDVPVMSNSKSEAYLKGENSTKIEDYWDSCAPDEETHQLEQKAPSGGNSTPRTATTEELLGLNEPARHSPAPGLHLATRTGRPQKNAKQDTSDATRKPWSLQKGCRKDRMVGVSRHHRLRHLQCPKRQ